MPGQEVTVAIADNYLNRFDEVAAACEAQGLEITLRLPAGGVLIGNADPTIVPALKQTLGVAAVEAVQGYQLPPADSDVQ